MPKLLPLHVNKALDIRKSKLVLKASSPHHVINYGWLNLLICNDIITS